MLTADELARAWGKVPLKTDAWFAGGRRVPEAVKRRTPGTGGSVEWLFAAPSVPDAELLTLLRNNVPLLIEALRAVEAQREEPTAPEPIPSFARPVAPAATETLGGLAVDLSVPDDPEYRQWAEDNRSRRARAHGTLGGGAS